MIFLLVQAILTLSLYRVSFDASKVMRRPENANDLKLSSKLSVISSNVMKDKPLLMRKQQLNLKCC